MFWRILSDLGDTFQWVVAVGSVIFLVQYTLYGKWWRNFVGRSVFLLDLVLLCILGPSLTVLVDPATAPFLASHGYALLETCALALGAYVVITRILGWRKLQRLRHPRNGHSSPDRDAGPEG